MIPAKREEMVWIIQLLNGLVEWSFWNSTRLCTIAVKNIAESRIKKDKLILQVVRIFANRTVQYKFLLVDIWEYPDLEYLCLHWSKIMLLLESEMRSSNMFCPSLVHSTSHKASLNWSHICFILQFNSFKCECAIVRIYHFTTTLLHWTKSPFAERFFLILCIACTIHTYKCTLVINLPHFPLLFVPLGLLLLQ